MDDGKNYKVTRTVNGVKEYLTMDLNPTTMKTKFYYAPRSCSYTFELDRAADLAALHEGQVEPMENDK